MNSFPRTLILSSSVFNQFTGGGVFLSNLFRGWPADKLGIVYGDTFEPDRTVCKNFFRLTSKEMHPAGLLNFLHRPPPGGSGGLAQPSRPPTLLQKIKTRTKPAMTRLLGLELPWVAHISAELQTWVDRFQPELLYTLVGGAYMRLTVRMGEKWNVPIVAHMMDDWPSQLEREPALIPYFRNKTLGDLRELFGKAALRMAICEDMAQAFEKKYGHPFLPFQNAVETSDRLPHSRKDWSAHSVFRLCYVGSILPNAQLRSLIDMAQAVSQLSNQGLNIALGIYSPWSKTYEKELRISAAVHLHPPLDEEHIFSALTSSDVLLIPVNFDEKSLIYIRYSMPAKVPLYLVSGTPVLIYGPAGAASVRYASQGGWGHVVSQQGVAPLVQAIQKLHADHELRAALGRRAKELAVQNHDGPRVRDQFRAALSQAAARQASRLP